MMICLLRHTHFLLLKNQMCYLLLYAFSDLNDNILISLYKVYVRSLLDYASIIYSPY